MFKNQWILSAVILLSFVSLSCQHHYHHKRHCKHHQHKHKCKGQHKCSKCSFKKESVAVVSALNNSEVKGSVRFIKKEKKSIVVSAHITGLNPEKKYGFHIHQYGDCREEGKNAGTHLNPYKTKHGSPDSKDKHMGDLGNLESDAKGTAVYEKTINNMCLYKLSGRSVIIHAQEDDLKSQPSGNAGAYIGCGVIGWTPSNNE